MMLTKFALLLMVGVGVGALEVKWAGNDYTVTHSGATLFTGGSVAMFCDGAWYAASAGTLKPTNTKTYDDVDPVLGKCELGMGGVGLTREARVHVAIAFACVGTTLFSMSRVILVSSSNPIPTRTPPCCVAFSRHAGPLDNPTSPRLVYMSQFSVTLFRFGIALPGTILGREGMCGWVGREGDFTFFLTHFVCVCHCTEPLLLFSHAIIPHYLVHDNQSTNRA